MQAYMMEKPETKTYVTMRSKDERIAFNVANLSPKEAKEVFRIGLENYKKTDIKN